MRYSLTCGVFDCLHYGHVNLFKEMLKESENIIVLMHDDLSTFKNKGHFPIQKYDHRADNVRATGLVYNVIQTREADPATDLIFTINCYKPGIYIRGDDWSDFPGRWALEMAGVKIKLVPYTKGISSTMIREGLKCGCLRG